jgi:hypothetical protein
MNDYLNKFVGYLIFEPYLNISRLTFYLKTQKVTEGSSKVHSILNLVDPLGFIRVHLKVHPFSLEKGDLNPMNQRGIV